MIGEDLYFISTILKIKLKNRLHFMNIEQNQINYINQNY
jgi:hypothetical protein